MQSPNILNQPQNIQKDFFYNNKYLLLNNGLSFELLSIIKNYVELEKKKGKKKIDPMFPNAFCMVNDALCESILLNFHPIIEQISGKKLFPTYSYLRIYTKGDVLEKHVDRRACEYSCSITLDYEAERLWPIFIKPFDKDIKLEMDRGDVLLYKGCEVEHWRDKFKEGNSWIQLFLHYVDANGEYSNEKFDKRSEIGSSYSTRPIE